MWITDFPLAPSVNSYLMPVVIKGQTRLVKKKIHREFLDQCHRWASDNKKEVDQIRKSLQRQLAIAKKESRQFALAVEMYFVFGKGPRVSNNDADNRVKPTLDAIVSIFGIDDRYVYSGLYEKVSATDGGQECTILRINQTTPRLQTQVHQMIQESIRDSSS